MVAIEPMGEEGMVRVQLIQDQVCIGLLCRCEEHQLVVGGEMLQGLFNERPLSDLKLNLRIRKQDLKAPLSSCLPLAQRLGVDQSFVQVKYQCLVSRHLPQLDGLRLDLIL